MAVCDIPGCDEHYACRLRAKGMQLSKAITPTRHSNRPKVLTQHDGDPKWEKGIAGEHRPGGGFMPYLGENREPIRLKEHGERRHEIHDQVQRLKSDPTVFQSERGGTTESESR